MAKQKTSPAAHAEADETVVGTALATARAGAPLVRHEEDLALFQLGQQVGGVKMARLQRNFSAAAEVRLFAEIRNSNGYKHLALPRPAGPPRAAENLAEFCQLVFGRSYTALAEDAQNLELLGEQSYDLAASLGLNRNALRAVRALPPEKLAKVQAAIATGAAKTEVLAVIEDLAVRVEQAAEQLLEADAALQVANEAREKQRVRIDKLQAEVKRFNKLPPDEQLAVLQQAALREMRDAQACIRGSLRQALQAIDNHGEDRGQHDRFLAGLLAEVQHDLNDLRAQFALPDNSEGLEPEWLSDEKPAAGGKGKKS